MPLTGHVAIYGGSFDPPHIGHQIACMWLTQALNAEVVLIVPTYEHYFGKQLVKFEHRMLMTHLMIEDFGDKVLASNVERFLPKPNTTLGLVEAVKTFYPGKPLSVVIGTDLVSSLHKWHEWDKVAEQTRVVAVGRAGYENAISPYDIYQYPIELSAVSSSAIRERIKNNDDITGMVPSKIKQYIEEHELYVQNDSGAGQP